MTNGELADQLVELVDFPTSLDSFIAGLDDDTIASVAPALKQRALYYLQRDAPLALGIAELILRLGHLRNLPLVRALGLQTKAIALTLAQREFEEALRLFAASEAIYREQKQELDIAVGQVSRIWALACLQRYDEAFAASEWTKEVLTRHSDYRSLAALNNNLAAIYGRRGQDAHALALFREVEAAYDRLGEEGRQRKPLALFNQAIVLRNMGRFQESIAANEAALELAVELDQKANIARAEQNLGITYFLLGHINKAQALLQKARDSFLSDHRQRDAIMAELFVSDALLHLRRFEDVLTICERVEETFQQAGTRFEVAQALLNEAAALSALNADDRALVALQEARQIFEEEGNEAWRVFTDIEEATILLRRRQYAKSLALAMASITRLRALDLPLKEAQSLILAAQAAHAQGAYEQAARFLERAQVFTSARDTPDLSYKAHYVQGQIAQSLGDNQRALAAFDQAIQELERLQSRIMVEFRADFLADKEEVYKQAVALCIESDYPERALGYAERAKSRALLSMLSHHVDLRIEAKSAADQQLVERITTLRERRDRLYRRWETGETAGSTVNRQEQTGSAEASHREALQTILHTEDEIRTLWHQLLVSNTAYARDASLWQVQTELNLDLFDEETLLVEYFMLPDNLVAFLVSQEGVQAVPLAVTSEGVRVLQQKLQHNFSTLKKAPHLAERLVDKAQAVLHDLYLALAAPWIGHARHHERLVIVPHGPLHYLPMHALFDGQRYLLERFQISYLPGVSFQQKNEEATSGRPQALVLGHSQQGRLQFVSSETETIARALGTRPYLDEEATRDLFQREAPHSQVIHVAAHGDFNSNNPLFSGLHLGDGLLTTLDIFNMRLPASLVTLSACQTGRNFIGGGDELFGLTRAFLTAGTSSLILSLWPVEDRSTTHLMNRLYRYLLEGHTKVEALQLAQEDLMAGDQQGNLLHPYYWAPFFLMGDPGAI